MSVLSAFPLPPETTVGMGFPTDDSLVVSSFPPVAVAEKQGKDTLNTSQQSLQDPCLPQDPTLTVWDVHCRSVRDRDRRSYGRRWPGRKESYKKHRRALSVPLVQPHGTIPHAAVGWPPHQPGGKCSGLKPGRRNGGGGGGGTPGANPGGGIPKGAVKAGGWSAPTTGGPDGWGGT